VVHAYLTVQFDARGQPTAEISEGQVWTSGEGYERYVGRWSRVVAREFVAWLGVRPGASWLDVGCGTGALSESILSTADPGAIRGIDPSEAFVDHARRALTDPRASFEVGSAEPLPYQNGQFDAVACGLVLNFLPDAPAALVEMRRVASQGGVVGAYVWDYAGRMEMMRYFWDAAAELDWLAESADEGARFTLCRKESLYEAFTEAGLREVDVRAIDAPTTFHDFDDFWTPFLTGHAPAPAYNMSLSEEKRGELRELIRSRLPFQPDGSIQLVARAWAARGRR
jgi:ubiquinone/menaquinone biosynthesis C-methylase UbiE